MDARADIKTEKEKKKIVVVDDDLDTQDLISAFFKPRGFEVICFGDAESAIADGEKSSETWDVILSDLRLPKMSGVELTAQMKETAPQTPVILITTNRSTEVALEAIKEGAYDFLIKPLNLQQLQIAVERALHIKTLSRDLVNLQSQIETKAASANGMIGKSAAFLAAVDLAKRVAKSRSNIIITGESGTGKEVFARFIHTSSLNKKGPFIAINCSAIPETLLESELFGHAKGAFTGANEKKLGLFEEAQDGTLFLDEIGDLSLPLQAKLLRVLQERKIRRVGENQDRNINCRLVSATHKNLSEMVATGQFREDLFFRLNVIPIHLPPLRERQEDILPLAEGFLKKFAAENQTPITGFTKEAVRFILSHPWNGNVRELENTIERAAVLTQTNEIDIADLMPNSMESQLKSQTKTAQSPFEHPSAVDSGQYFRVDCSGTLPSLNDMINSYIQFAVTKNAGAKDRTAKEIGVDRKTLYKRLKIATGENLLS